MGGKILICYKSVTGFTKQYAEMIADKIDCTLMDFRTVTAETLSGYDTVIFGSRFHAGTVDGLKQAKALVRKSRINTWILFATGATPPTAVESIQSAWQNNLTPEELQNIPHFYMPSGLRYENMPLPDRLMMKVFSVMVRWKQGAYEEGIAQAVTRSFDISSPAYIEPLLTLLQNTVLCS